MAKAFKNIDLRVSLALMAVNSVAVALCKKEVYFVALIVVSAMWLFLKGKPLKAVGFMLAYTALYGLFVLTAGVRQLSTIMLFANVLRHLLIPIAYADGISDAPTGTLLVVFQRLGLPKSFGISTSVLLRFIPTIGSEFGRIRSSLKFRNTGVGIINTLLHIPSNFERTIVPLLIRVTRISEELSAAAMVRGVRLNNDIISFDEVKFKVSDIIITVLFSLAAAVCVAERVVQGAAL